MRPTKEILNKFSNAQLEQIMNEFFNEGIYKDFYDEVMINGEIIDAEEFFRDFAIEHIRDEVSFEDLVESGWCFEDEMDDND